MISNLRRRPSHATIVAYLALFVALGGTTFAAASLPAKSVGTKQLRNGAVTRVKLHANAVTAAKVAKHSLTGADIKNLTRTDFRGGHLLSASGEGSLESKSGTIGADGTLALAVVCPAGAVATGGGYLLQATTDAVKALVPARNAYVLNVHGKPGNQATVYAVCER